MDVGKRFAVATCLCQRQAGLISSLVQPGGEGGRGREAGHSPTSVPPDTAIMALKVFALFFFFIIIISLFFFLLFFSL